MRHLPLLVLLVACGGTGATSDPDAPQTVDAALDAPATDALPDATPCVPTGRVKVGTAHLTNVAVTKALALDGVGARCDQLARAILDPVQRVSQIAKLDATGETHLCVLGGVQEHVSIDIQRLNGKELVSTGQYLRVVIDPTTDSITQIREGFFIEPPALTPNSCAPEPSTLAVATGYEEPYTWFQFCIQMGSDKWKILANDPRTIHSTGLYLDGDELIEVRKVDAKPHPTNETQQLRDSDMNCLDTGITLRLIVDPDTNRVLETRRLCVVC